MGDPIRGIVADQIIDKREARQIVWAYGAQADIKPLAKALAANQHLSQDDATRTAKAIQDLAKDPLIGKFIHFRPGTGIAEAPDLSHEGVVIVGSADVTRAKVSGVDAYTLKSWTEFRPLLQRIKATLDQRRQRDPQAHLTMILNVHGNNGTGFKVVHSTDTKQADGTLKRTEASSVASAAYIQQELAAAGLKPEDVTLVSEACNGARSYIRGIDGLSEQDRASIKREVINLAGEDAADWKGKRTDRIFETGKPEILDAVPANAKARTRSYTWVGWQQGVNATYCFLSYGAGQRTKPLVNNCTAQVVVGSARMVTFNTLPSASITGGMLANTNAQRAELEKQFAANGGGKPFPLAAPK